MERTRRLGDDHATCTQFLLLQWHLQQESLILLHFRKPGLPQDLNANYQGLSLMKYSVHCSYYLLTI